MSIQAPIAIRDVTMQPGMVLIQDPSGKDPIFRHSTIGRTKSRRMLGEHTLEIRCVLPAGDTVSVPAGFVRPIASEISAVVALVERPQ